ncbi:MAG TPA: energy transducer TonB [Rhizomicrobium sp.]|nr:energy transducer TonB [Rhizomicrobium sp.]
MERPNHLNVADKSAASRATSIAIVIGIHVGVIFGLVAALNQGELLKQLSEIKATVDTPKEIPKPPPPPPPDLVKPPPPVAIVPDFQVASAPPPPVTTVAKPPPAPPAPAAPRISDVVLAPIARTRTKPPYPAISLRLGESGTTQIEVKINTEGSVTECTVAKTSGSERLDTAACEHAQRFYKWRPPTSQGQPVAATTRLNMVWDLKDAK